MSDSVEVLAHRFQDPASVSPLRDGRRGCYWCFRDKVFISRGSASEFEVFVVGEEQTFGPVPAARAFTFDTYSLTSGKQVPALRIALLDRPGSERLAAHLAYELCARLEQDPTLANASLVRLVQPFFALVAESLLLTPDEQTGLAGELEFLRRLVLRARQLELGTSCAFGAWVGWMPHATRDFRSAGIAVECKATGGQQRVHPISSMTQLEPANDEEQLLLFSMSAKRDPSGSFWVTTLVDEIVQLLDLADRQPFLEALSHYGSSGFLAEDRQYYERQLPFLSTRFPARLFVIDDRVERLRPSSFVGGDAPARCRDIRYSIDLSGFQVPGNPLDDAGEQHALDRLLAVPRGH